MKKTLITSLLICVCISVTSQTTWIADNDHSSVQFEVSHLVISTVVGDFTKFNAKVLSSSDKSFENSEITAEIEVSSVDTRNLTRDNHLKKDDFFNAAKFPMIKFKSKAVKKEGNNKYIIEGDLTIRDVTKPIQLEVDYGGMVELNGVTRAGMIAKGSINRFDYNLKWDDTLDNGSMVVGENVDIKLNIELIKQ